MDLFETIMGAMERTRILKDEALHPIKKIQQISQLVRKGYLKKEEKKARSIVVIKRNE